MRVELIKKVRLRLLELVNLLSFGGVLKSTSLESKITHFRDPPKDNQGHFSGLKSQEPRMVERSHCLAEHLNCAEHVEVSQGQTHCAGRVKAAVCSACCTH